MAAKSVSTFYESMTPERKAGFLESLRRTGSIAEAAAENSGATRAGAANTFRYWIKRDSEFAQSVDAAMADFRESLLQEAWRRAVVGNRKAAGFYRGRQGVMADGTPAFEYVQSDQILLALLKRHFPEFQDRKVIEGHIQHSHAYAIDPGMVHLLSASQRENLVDILNTFEAAKPDGEEIAIAPPRQIQDAEFEEVDPDVERELRELERLF